MTALTILIVREIAIDIIRSSFLDCCSLVKPNTIAKLMPRRMAVIVKVKNFFM